MWVLGGDGVVNEALNGIRDGVALGIVPAGGANVVARALGARERRISVGRVNGRRFAFSAGIGVDSEVVRDLETGSRAQERAPGEQPPVRASCGRAAAPRIGITARGRGARAGCSDLRLERRGLHVRGSAAAALRPRRAIRARPRLRRARSRDAALFGKPVHARVGGRGMAGASGVLTGHDLDRIEVRCDCRCRSRRTARTSAT